MIAVFYIYANSREYLVNFTGCQGFPESIFADPAGHEILCCQSDKFRSVNHSLTSIKPIKFTESVKILSECLLTSLSATASPF